ncbi:hypothetical protein E2562_009913 [Oryza meyeriana var. granulata]|uniref:Uncharacterized protein n=1 Tax=Oryza meyeriana var. granulata TaxID=110450 RepID=A0A6G1BT36_9ORYZ|nr:hypothetical protein E2562_009913 [Oryza meyeriana var. granulata]
MSCTGWWSREAGEVDGAGSTVVGDVARSRWLDSGSCSACVGCISLTDYAGSGSKTGDERYYAGSGSKTGDEDPEPDSPAKTGLAGVP